jgi:hypothetical protein
MGNAYCFNSAGDADWMNSTGIGENVMVFDSNTGTMLFANPWEGRTSLVNWSDGTAIWTRSEAGLADFGDVDGDGADDIIVISTKYYDPPFPTQHMRAVDSANYLLWEFQLDAEPSAIVVANIDADANDEILVTIGNKLHAFDVEPATHVDSMLLQKPRKCLLHQNYPNPFNMSTMIAFEIPTRERVTLQIYNAYGRRIRTLQNNDLSAGLYTLFWDGCDDMGNCAPSGLYLCRFMTTDFSQTNKMLLMR